MEHFKASKDHDDELSKYTVMAYVSYISDMIKLLTEKGIEATILVLTKMKNSYGPPAS